MALKLATFFLFIIPAISYAEVCTNELLISNTWVHMRSGDVYTLNSDGDMKCRNEKRHRSECDYVYSSDFVGIPKSWKLIDKNKVTIKFDTGVFKSETVEYECSYSPSENELHVGDVIFIRVKQPNES